MSSSPAGIDNLFSLSCKCCAFHFSYPIHLLVLFVYLSRTAVANMVDITHTIIELATFQVLTSLMWPVSTMLHKENREHFHHCRKSYSSDLKCPACIVSHSILYDLYCLAPITPLLMTHSILQQHFICVGVMGLNTFHLGIQWLKNMFTLDRLIPFVSFFCFLVNN